LSVKKLHKTIVDDVLCLEKICHFIFYTLSSSRKL